MEYATGILLAESAVSNFGSLASNFPRQVSAMLARLDAAREARPIPAGTGALIDGIFRRAQERILLAQVAREIQTNLRRMEQVLDAFFRDPTKRSEIAALATTVTRFVARFKCWSRMMPNACSDSARRRSRAMRIRKLPSTKETSSFSRSRCVDWDSSSRRCEQQRSDHQRLIAPLLAKRLGETPDRGARRGDGNGRGRGRGLRGMLPTARRGNPSRAGRRRSARRIDVEAQGSRRRCHARSTTPTSSNKRSKRWRSSTRCRRSKQRGEDTRPSRWRPRSPLSPRAARRSRHLLRRCRRRRSGCSRPTPTASTPSFSRSSSSRPTEVLDAVVENRAQLERNPGDREALRSARRQFHTIKGSGRMVGLSELGELAYDVEKIHNRLLEEEPVSCPRCSNSSMSPRRVSGNGSARSRTRATSMPIPRSSTPPSAASKRSCRPNSTPERRRCAGRAGCDCNSGTGSRVAGPRRGCGA